MIQDWVETTSQDWIKLSPKCVWIVVIYCDKSVTKIQQVLLGIFAGSLKLLNILVKKWWVGGGSNPGPPD